MNLRQLEYVLALAEQQHFERAAEKSFVSQSTLSTMIGRLEQELGILLFDRSTKPIALTKEGEVLLARMRLILKEVESLSASVEEMKGEIQGVLSIAAIPTIAPFILPRILWKFAQRFPKIKIEVRELITEHIIKGLNSREIDIGIIATPTLSTNLQEHVLYNEPFYLFDYYSEKVPAYTRFDDLDYSKMLFLEEGHCLNDQVDTICRLSRRTVNPMQNITFKAGSIDSLVRITKINKGITLLPKLATYDFSKAEKKRLSQFQEESAFRTVRLAVHQHFVKRSLLDALVEDIKEKVGPYLV